jgi:AcrR family transcriptional regulator
MRDRPERSTSRGSATIERALDAVATILDGGGEGSVRVARVSKLAGVSIGSLYHHFGSREGLIARARERQFRESLTYRNQTQTEAFLGSPTPREFIECFDESLLMSEEPDVAAGRQRRFEMIGAAAQRPSDLPGVVALESAYLDAGEVIGQALADRGWLQDGVEPRAVALFLHSLSMVRVVRDLDGSVSSDEWRTLARRALEGMLVLDPAEDAHLGIESGRGTPGSSVAEDAPHDGAQRDEVSELTHL